MQTLLCIQLLQKCDELTRGRRIYFCKRVFFTVASASKYFLEDLHENSKQEYLLGIKLFHKCGTYTLRHYFHYTVICHRLYQWASRSSFVHSCVSNEDTRKKHSCCTQGGKPVDYCPSPCPLHKGKATMHVPLNS